MALNKRLSQLFFSRSKSTTLLNSGSSRSHAVYTLTLKRENLAQDVVFNVVDLAGAERRYPSFFSAQSMFLLSRTAVQLPPQKFTTILAHMLAMTLESDDDALLILLRTLIIFQ